ncbi:MAG: hypothetical protein V1747_00505 [Candidatus Omnitrophota bacterium]
MKKQSVCDSCGDLIKKRQKYSLKIELSASAEVEIEQKDLEGDLNQQLSELYDGVRDIDAKKLEEDIYIRYDLKLCKKCRDIFNQRIKAKEFV